MKSNYNLIIGRDYHIHLVNEMKLIAKYVCNNIFETLDVAKFRFKIKEDEVTLFRHNIKIDKIGEVMEENSSVEIWLNNSLVELRVYFSYITYLGNNKIDLESIELQEVMLGGIEMPLVFIAAYKNEILESLKNLLTSREEDLEEIRAAYLFESKE